MRIVRNLENTNECPNCGCHMLYWPIMHSTSECSRPMKICTRCSEEIFEEKNSCYIEPIVVERAPDDIDDILMDIEYDVGMLPRHARNQNDLDMAERVKGIFERILTVIRRIK